jgi:hypothetical protein
MIDPEDLKIRYYIFVYDTYKIHCIQAGTWPCANLPCTRLTPHSSTAWISDYSPVCSPDQRRASTACSRSTGSKALRSARHQKPRDRDLEIANLFLACEKGNLPRGNGIFPRATDVVAGNRGCSRFTKSAFHRGRILYMLLCVCMCLSLSLSLAADCASSATPGLCGAPRFPFLH